MDMKGQLKPQPHLKPTTPIKQRLLNIFDTAYCNYGSLMLVTHAVEIQNRHSQTRYLRLGKGRAYQLLLNRRVGFPM